MIFGEVEKNYLQQPLISPPNLLALKKKPPLRVKIRGPEVARIPSCRSKSAYGAANLKVEGRKRIKSGQGFFMQMFKRETIYKSG